MSITLLFALLGGLITLAFVANQLFKRTRVPDVIVLMVTGLILGPLLGRVTGTQFQPITHARGSTFAFLPALAFATILATNLMVIIGSIRASRIPASVGEGKSSSEKEPPKLIAT
jgi:Kef-type K+ transport system membrane component KefB